MFCAKTRRRGSAGTTGIEVLVERVQAIDVPELRMLLSLAMGESVAIREWLAGLGIAQLEELDEAWEIPGQDNAEDQTGSAGAAT